MDIDAQIQFIGDLLVKNGLFSADIRKKAGQKLLASSGSKYKSFEDYLIYERLNWIKNWPKQ